jgi:hypothetical protein
MLSLHYEHEFQLLHTKPQILAAEIINIVTRRQQAQWGRYEFRSQRVSIVHRFRRQLAEER